MQLHYQPVGPLANFIELFWYWQEPDLLKGLECVLPTGTVELVIDLDSRRSADSVIAGVKSRPVIIAREGDRPGRLLGIHFKPGGAFPFLPFPLNELHNCDLTLADLWGEAQFCELLSMIHGADSIPEKFRLLEQWLMVHTYHPLLHHPSVSFSTPLLLTMPNIPMQSLTEKVNLSQRHFIHIFQKEMGFTPKLFSRIARFQRVLNKIESISSIDWFDVATDCGYYDQSHFIHEFQEFSGISPTAYMGLRTEHRNHLPRTP